MTLPPRVALATWLALGAAPALADSFGQRFEYRQLHMGVEVRIVLYVGGAARARAAADRAFSRIARIDAALSDYRADSELSRICRRAGSGPQAVGDDLFCVLSRAKALSARTDGAFEVSLGPLSRLWRRACRKARLPAAGELAAARALAGPDLWSLDRQAHTVDLTRAGMRLDLGGIAKGYAADEATRELRRSGVERSLVALAGDIVVTAPPPARGGWRVGIASPGSGTTSPGTLELSHAAVSTSGDAEQFLEIGGMRYSHVLDPRTGLGLTRSRQVTVVAADGITADSLATAACVLGPGTGLELVDATEGAAALMLVSSPTLRETYESRRWGEVSPGRP